ncbi:DUF1772 domain-containing protein [Streptomyces sp. CA-251247]|uniref:anthrone oxygenase family protein n=1 Tax=Streptomyces sp. CA-251247 TaxID=3240062 RepID=UPI003D940F7E
MTQNTTENRSGGRGGRAALAAATATTGLVAGIWFAYAISVMPALARSDDRTYIEVMQNVDDVIQNPLFFLVFLGALVLTAIAGRQQWRSPLRPWVLAALVLYSAAFLSTVLMSVPLNEELVAAGDPARIADPAAVRDAYEDPWVAWNIVRGVLNTAALGCLCWASTLMRQTSPYLVSAAGSSASR